MGGTECETGGVNSSPALQAGSELVANRGRDAGVVHGHQNCGAIFIRADGERFGIKVLCDAFRFGFSHGVATKTDRISRGDVHFCDPDGKELLFLNRQAVS